MFYGHESAMSEQIRYERGLACLRKLAKSYEATDGCDEEGFDIVACAVECSGYGEEVDFSDLEDDLLPF